MYSPLRHACPQHNMFKLALLYPNPSPPATPARPVKHDSEERLGEWLLAEELVGREDGDPDSSIEMGGVPRDKARGLGHISLKRSEDERISEAQTHCHQVENAPDPDRGNRDVQGGSRHHMNSVSLGEVVIQLPELIGGEVKGEDATDFEEIYKGCDPAPGPGDAVQERTVSPKMTVPGIP